MKKKRNKPKEYLFVDGYNIINSWSNLKELGKDNLELARDELIETLAEYKYYSGIEVILVFDAHLVKGNNGTKEIRKDLLIIYTKENETADAYIEKVLDEIGKVKRVRVATSDWMEQQIVLGRGGTRISARGLEVEIFNHKRSINRKNRNINEKNDLMLGRLDEEILNKLNNWEKSGK